MPVPAPSPGNLDIIINIETSDNGHYILVSYTYIDPQTSIQITTQTCTLRFQQPTYCKFKLSDTTKQAGWLIDGLNPISSPASVQWWLEGNAPGTTEYSVLKTLDYDYYQHSFFINFHNKITGTHLSDDPQEGNIPPPPTV
jgi:hypothetical protein